MPTRETRFADEVTRHSYQLALKEMDAQIGDADVTAVVMLQTNEEVTIDARQSGPQGVHKVHKAAKRAGAQQGMAADWLRQLARITRGVERDATIYSGTSLTVATSPGQNTNSQGQTTPQPSAGGPRNGLYDGSRNSRSR